MVSEVKRTNTPITYTSDNSQMCLHIKERTRWFALTRSDLMGKLYECLKDRFGQVKHEELQDFVLKIVNGLWGGRRTKKEIRLCSKKVWCYQSLFCSCTTWWLCYQLSCVSYIRWKLSSKMNAYTILLQFVTMSKNAQFWVLISLRIVMVLMSQVPLEWCIYPIWSQCRWSVVRYLKNDGLSNIYVYIFL